MFYTSELTCCKHGWGKRWPSEPGSGTWPQTSGPGGKVWEKTGCISSCCSSAPSLRFPAAADVSHLTSPHQAPCGAACPACTLPAGHEHGNAAEHSLHRRGLVPSGHKLPLGAIQAQMLWDSQSRWALSSARLAWRGAGGAGRPGAERRAASYHLPAGLLPRQCPRKPSLQEGGSYMP